MINNTRRSYFCFFLGNVNYKPGRWNSVSRHGQTLVTKMLKTNPEKRLTIAEVIEHAWLRDPTVTRKVKSLVFTKEYASLFPCDQLLVEEEMQPPPKRRRRVT
jgi:serine/threonine protein kinase